MLVKIKEHGKDEVLVVSSREVAEDFEKRHDNIIRDIETLKKDVLNFEEMFLECREPDRYGRHQKVYLLTRDGFSLLVMGFTGEKALQWKLKYIHAFNEMERELKRLYEERKKWEIERAKGILVRHILTDTIKMKVSDSPHKKFMYPNYTKLIYKVIFNMSMEELKSALGIKGKESVRDALNTEEIKEVEHLEMLVSSLIGLGMGYQEIKEFIVEKYHRQEKLAG